MARIASRLAEGNDLSVPRGATPRMGARYDADAFGRFSEAIARFLGTGRFLAGQTVLVVGWIVLNTIGIVNHWDPYPFILLNLAFSTQAAYAAPLILLAQNRQADRDRLSMEEDRRRAALQKADTEYLSREIAALRIAIGEVTTRDFVRSELSRLAEELDEAAQRRHRADRKHHQKDLRRAVQRADADHSESNGFEDGYEIEKDEDELPDPPAKTRRRR